MGCTREDAANIGFDDQFIYDEIEKDIDNRQLKIIRLMRKDALKAFELWETKQDRTDY
jgi:hypothetical protein